MTRPKTVPAIGQETIPVGEDELIATLLAIHGHVQEAFDRKHQPVPRGQHPKQHGCVRGELIVAADLPDNLKHGIFKQPRTFPALIRFSNARQSNDHLPDVHGMSIKLLGVEGPQLLEGSTATTQDFVLIDHPVFFARSVDDLIPLLQDFRRLMLGGAAARMFTVAKGIVSPDHRFRLLRAMLRKRPDSPLGIQYWTTTPLRLGQGAIKLTARPSPASAKVDSPPATISPDKLRIAMADHLRKRDAVFDVLAQVQVDPVRMPIEDPTIPWDEAISPYRQVASLRLPLQRFDSDEQTRFGENLSFSPWHGLQDHRPLGGINRARRRLYEALAQRRRQWNGAEAREPTVDDANALWRGP